MTYDIRFYAQAPRDGALMEIIVNVEAQNKYNPGYPLIKRGVYYVSRMISAQNGVDFKNGEYGKLKKGVLDLDLPERAERAAQQHYALHFAGRAARGE